jgi:site-specific DNA-methyltransferase (adenine-specific)
MASLPDGAADMVFTDPPYGHNHNNGDLIHRWEAALGRLPSGGDPPPGRPIAGDGPEANTLFRDALPHYRRLLARGGCCCCCCCGGGGPDPQFARWSLWLDEVLAFKQMVVWDKGPMGMGWHYRRSYETVLVAQKRGGPCKWHDDTRRIENVIRPGAHGVRKIIPRADQHPTQKPPELAAYFIRLHTLPGETVLDSFMGAGSTGLAALRLGRRFLGIELDREHFRVAKGRLQAALKEQPELAAA